MKEDPSAYSAPGHNGGLAAWDLGHTRTVDGCVEAYRENLATDMEWEDFKVQFDEPDKRIDKTHNKLIENFCRSAYLDEHANKTQREKILKKQFKDMDDSHNKLVLRNFGEEKVAAD